MKLKVAWLGDSGAFGFVFSLMLIDVYPWVRPSTSLCLCFSHKEITLLPFCESWIPRMRETVKMCRASVNSLSVPLFQHLLRAAEIKDVSVNPYLVLCVCYSKLRPFCSLMQVLIMQVSQKKRPEVLKSAAWICYFKLASSLCSLRHTQCKSFTFHQIQKPFLKMCFITFTLLFSVALHLTQPLQPV